jgi:hypothetical protein
MRADRNCLVFERTLGDERLAVALNFSGKSVESRLIPVGAQILLSTHLDRENSLADGRLRLTITEADDPSRSQHGNVTTPLPVQHQPGRKLPTGHRAIQPP